jgi:Predicted hydrolases or acyltransferases (alpha/beta hydrolase superfamily)
MPKIKVNNLTMNYEQQGAGEPLLLIPYLAADNACYAFQLADYAKHFNCISVDLRGAGETDKPTETYSTELFAEDVAADLVLELGLPIETDGAGNVAGVIGFGIDVNFDQLDAWCVKILFDPIGRDEDVRMCVACSHNSFQACVPDINPAMCLAMLDVYLNMLSGKIITPRPILSRRIISRAPS